jgi:multidrug efflux pump subunit AcrA (membrane-fusion protein)
MASRDASQRTAAVSVIRTAPITTGNLDHVIRVAGQTTAINFANITAPRMTGPEANRELILLRIATPGSWVKKGTLIAQIDAQALADHVDDINDTVQGAEADIRKREAEHGIEWENLQQTVRIAKSEMDKARLDYSVAEVKTDVERQLLKLALDEAEARYKQVQADLGFKKESQAAELAILRYTRDRHARHRDRHARDLRMFTVHAPMDGLVVMQQIWRGGEMGQVQQGDRVFSGQRFMQIVDTKKMQVEGFINQAESSDLRVNQHATISLDAFPGLHFKGRVYSIGALAVGGWRQNQYIRTIPVRVEIQGNDPRLIPDLSASANVVVASEQNKTLVPLSAVRDENGQTVAYVKQGGSFEKREVRLGLTNGTHGVVLAGLQPGEQVRIDN